MAHLRKLCGIAYVASILDVTWLSTCKFVPGNLKILFSSFPKVWEVVGKSDLGCTPGGGMDNAGVFTDAGLSVESNMGLKNPSRSGEFWEFCIIELKIHINKN